MTVLIKLGTREDHLTLHVDDGTLAVRVRYIAQGRFIGMHAI